MYNLNIFSSLMMTFWPCCTSSGEEQRTPN